MRIGHISLLASVLVMATSLSASTPKVRRGPTSPRLFKPKAAPRSHFSSLRITAERATQIQTALIRVGYLTGSPSGEWDSPTQAAMERMQSDNGWQTKLVPDARAIIKLGLGSSATTALAPSGTVGDPDILTFPSESHPVPAVSQ
jgi:peptidoglycan hydrolase-like protein with peptidoglycan-binding domain